MSRGVSTIGFSCALVFVSPASAHHSHGQYEQHFIDLEGTVTEVQLINPHSWVYLDVLDEQGQVISWALEATGVAGLARRGVERGHVNPGDTVKVRCHPARDGSEGCLLGFLQAADGSIRDWDGGQAQPVDDGFFDLKR
jgi:hypothetical protein